MAKEYEIALLGAGTLVNENQSKIRAASRWTV